MDTIYHFCCICIIIYRLVSSYINNDANSTADTARRIDHDCRRSNETSEVTEVSSMDAKEEKSIGMTIMSEKLASNVK